ncbi:MAG: tRNA (adenine(22)-N(1))-methyltransferase [Christensenellales bacterium]
MIKLSDRLKELVKHVDGESVADVGCDHGKVAVYCALSGKRAIATDISEQSLHKAERLAKQCSVAVKTILCDGLDKVESKEVDVVIIAGMGGIEIGKILADGARLNKTFKKYVLSPNTDAKVVREFLQEKRIGISRDYMIEDKNKFYSIIVAGDCEFRQLDDFELEFGMEYKTCPTSLKYLKKEYSRLKSVSEKLEGNSKNRFNLLRETDEIVRTE